MACEEKNIQTYFPKTGLSELSQCLTCEGSCAVTLVHIPELELGVSGGGDDVLAAEELDVGHGLAVTLEHV